MLPIEVGHFRAAIKKDQAVNRSVAESSEPIGNIPGQRIEAACRPTILEACQQSIQWSLSLDVALMKRHFGSAQDPLNSIGLDVGFSKVQNSVSIYVC